MTRPLASAALAGLVLAFGARSEAQSWDVSLLAGYTPQAALDRRAPELDALHVAGGFTWGVSASRSFGQRWSGEILWTQQRTGLKLGLEAGSPTLFDFRAGNLHGNAVYRFASRDAKLRPFLFGGLGATFFSGGGQPSETKLSWGLGGGVEYYAWRKVGFRGQVRYKPVILSDEDSGDFCDPFGFCQGWLHQLEVVGGVVLRF